MQYLAGKPDEEHVVRRTELLPTDIARRLVGVPWRNAGLVALFAALGALGSGLIGVTTTALLPAIKPPMLSAERIVSASSGDGVALRLDLDASVPSGPASSDSSSEAIRPFFISSQSGVAFPQHDNDVALRGIPLPGVPAQARTEQTTARTYWRPRQVVQGLLVGVLLGLLVASLRELFAEPLRTSREAEAALGVPVLGAIPTLSRRARNELLDPHLPSGSAA